MMVTASIQCLCLERRKTSVTAPSRASQSENVRSPRANELTSEAFAELYEQAYRTLVVVAIAQAGRTSAEDIVQQAAIMAWQRRGLFAPGTDFTAWLAAFVRGVARNHRRGERRLIKRHRARSSDPSLSPTHAGAISTPAPDPDPELHAALDTLSEAQRTCFLLRSIDGRSYEQIGTILDLPAATARTHVFRARQRLAAQLGDGQAVAQAGGRAHG